jgi:hypothetical protein
MKKVFFVFGLLCFSLFGAQKISAQTPTFNTKGDQLAGVTIGFGGYYSGSYYSDVSRTPYIAFYYENCVKENLFDEKSSLGLGGMLGHTSVKYSNLTSGFKANSIILGFRGILHYAFVDKLDTYGGLMLGYNIATWKWEDKNTTLKRHADGGFDFSLFVGARYYFTDTFAAFAELGIAVPINLGVSLKF